MMDIAFSFDIIFKLINNPPLIINLHVFNNLSNQTQVWGETNLFFINGFRQTAIQNNSGIAPRIRDMHLITLCLFTLATGMTSLELCQRLRHTVWGFNMLNAWGIVCNICNGIITKVYIHVNTNKNIQEYNVVNKCMMNWLWVFDIDTCHTGHTTWHNNKWSCIFAAF